jgi:2-hydroxychromene-2-carboxylate isomerase
MTGIEIFFDCSCVWAYLGHAHAGRFAGEIGAKLHLRPVLSQDVFAAVNPAALLPLPAVKQAYYARDVQLWADFLALPLAAGLPPQSDARDCMRACVAAARWDRLEAFAVAAFDAAWAQGEDLADRAILSGLWTRAGLPEALFGEALTWPGVDAELRGNARELAARGGFGTPTFFVGDDMYFGNDAVPLLENAMIARMKREGDLVSG